MLLMGDSSSMLSIIASSSSDQSLILYKILKFDGSLISGSSIVASCFQNPINVTLQSESNWKYETMIGNSPTEVYLGLTQSDSKYVGITKFTNLSASNNQDWITCETPSSGTMKITALCPHESSSLKIFAALRVKPALDYIDICSLFSTSQGSNNLMNWCLRIKFGQNPTQDYSIGRLLSFGGSGTNLLAVMYNEASNPTEEKIRLILLKGINYAPSSITYLGNVDIPGPSSSSSASLTAQQFVVGVSTGIYQVNQVKKDLSNSNYVYLLVLDLSKNGGTQSIIKLDFSSVYTGGSCASNPCYQYYSYDFLVSYGSSFQIYQLASSSSSQINDFYFAGKTSYVTDGSTTKSFSQGQGFIMKSKTTNSDLVCLSFPNGYAADFNSNFLKSALGDKFKAPVSQSLFNGATSTSQVSSTLYNTLKSQSTASTSKQTWCTWSPYLTMSPAGITQSIYYQSGDAEIKQLFSPTFQVNDTNCDQFYFQYVVNSTAFRYLDNSYSQNISNFPSVLNDSTSSGQYVSVYTKNYSDSSYQVNFTVKAYTPDYRTSQSVSGIIYVNISQVSAKPFIYPYDNLTYYSLSMTDTSELVTFPVSNYFVATNYSTQLVLSVIYQSGNTVPWISDPSIKDQNITFTLNKTLGQSDKIYFSIYEANTQQNIVSQKISISIISCGSAKIQMIDTKPLDTDSKASYYAKVDGHYRLIIIERLKTVSNYSAIMSSRFSTNLENCPVTGFSIVKVLIKSTLEEVSLKIWENLFQLTYSTGNFSITEKNQTFSNYLVFMSAENSYGTQGGADQYLIDLSLISDPYFLSLPQEFQASVFMNLQISQGKQYFKLPLLSNDTNSIQLENQNSFPYLSINTTYLTLDRDLVTQQNLGQNSFITRLTNTQGGYSEYTLKLKIQSEESSNYRYQVEQIYSNQVQNEINNQKITESIILPRNLSAFIKSIDSKGEMIVQFNDTLIFEGVDISLINSSNLNISIIPYLDPKDQRKINLSRLNFTWKAISLSKNQLKIQLNFSEPSAISPLLTQDQIELSFNGAEQYLVSAETNQSLHEDYWILEKRIPPQFTMTETAQSLFKSSEKVNIAMWIILTSGVVFTLFGQGNNKRMFGLMRALQMVLHLPMMMALFPPNVIFFYKIFVKICKFDILEYIFDWKTQKFIEFDWANQELMEFPYPDQFKDLGYYSPNAFIGLGTLSFLIILYYFKVIIFVLLTVWVDLTKGKYGGVSLKNFMRRTMFFKEIIGLSIESYFELLINGYMVMSYPIRTAVGEWISLFLGAYAFIVAAVILPILLITIVYLDRKYFVKQQPEMKKFSFKNNKPEEKKQVGIVNILQMQDLYDSGQNIQELGQKIKTNRNGQNVQQVTEEHENNNLQDFSFGFQNEASNQNIQKKELCNQQKKSEKIIQLQDFSFGQQNEGGESQVNDIEEKEQIPKEEIELSEQELNEKMGTICEGILVKDRQKRAYYLIFCLRRAIFVAIGFCFTKESQTGLQIVCLYLLSLFTNIYIGRTQAFEEKLDNQLDNINETVVFAISLHLLFFTEWIENDNLKLNLGWSMISFIILLIFINLVVIIYEICNQIKLLIIKLYNQIRYTCFGVRRRILDELPDLVRSEDSKEVEEEISKELETSYFQWRINEKNKQTQVNEKAKRSEFLQGLERQGLNIQDKKPVVINQEKINMAVKQVLSDDFMNVMGIKIPQTKHQQFTTQLRVSQLRNAQNIVFAEEPKTADFPSVNDIDNSDLNVFKFQKKEQEFKNPSTLDVWGNNIKHEVPNNLKELIDHPLFDKPSCKLFHEFLKVNIYHFFEREFENENWEELFQGQKSELNITRSLFQMRTQIILQNIIDLEDKHYIKKAKIKIVKDCVKSFYSDVRVQLRQKGWRDNRKELDKVRDNVMNKIDEVFSQV